jgi:EmrB/QacA subfamily drug resistance transporter
VLAICCLAQFMVVLDVTIVNVALPSMQKDLGLSGSGLQWVLNAYTLTFGGLLMFGGRAADLFGRRRVFVGGLAVFTGASLLGGFAQNETMLIVARAVQGLGGAALAPATLTLLMTSYREGPERTRALGAWGATAASGGAFGVLAGGLLTDLVNWRWVLFVNVPIGIALITAAMAVLSESRGQLSRFHDLDVPGTITVTGGVVALVYAIVRTDTYSWGSWQTLSALAGAAVLLAAFLTIEARSANPLVPLGIFRHRALAIADTIVGLLGAAMFGLFFFATLYLQQVHGFSPLKAGFALVPLPLAIIVGSQITTRNIGRFGARPLIFLGSLVAAVGLGWLAGISPDGSFWTHVFGPVILIGVGMGTNMVAITTAATNGVPPQLAGLASGLLNTGRMVGGAIGLAALSTLAMHRTEHLAAGGTPMPEALTSGYARGLVVCCAIMLAGALLALLLPKIGRPTDGQVTVPAQALAQPAQAAEPARA